MSTITPETNEHKDRIEHQRSLLRDHRRRLEHLLRQQARFGLFTPAYIKTEIEDARQQIKEIKDSLHTAGNYEPDAPGDKPGSSPVERRGGVLWSIGLPLLIILVTVMGFVAVNGGTAGAGQQLEEWGLRKAFPPEQPGEVLLVIAPFNYTENLVNTEAHHKIGNAIRAEGRALGLTQLRVEVATAPLQDHERDDDYRDEAEALGARYDASLVVWGKDAGTDVTVNFLNRRGTPQMPASSVTISETLRTQLADPPAYNRFIVEELPQHISFLSLFAVGQSAFIAEQYGDAIRIIERAVAVAPPAAQIDGLYSAYFRLGWLYQVSTQGIEKAIRYYDHTITLNPNDAAAYNNRGTAYWSQGKLEQARQDYTLALTLDDKLAAAYNNRGVVFSDQRNLAQAIADFEQALTLEPKFAIAYNNRGNAYADQGNLDQAIADYTQAISLAPNYAEAYSNRGNTYADQGDLIQAMRDYHQAIALNPKLAEAYVNRGNAYQQQGNLEQAMRDYNQAIALDPKLAQAYINRGVAYVEQGDLPRAIQDYTQAIMLDPTDGQAHYNRGVVYQQQGQLAQAIEDYTQALKFEPSHAITYNNRGTAYWQQGDLAQAIADYAQAITLAPNDARAYYNRGLLYQQQGEHALAIADFEQALKYSEDPELRRAAEERLRELRGQ